MKTTSMRMLMALSLVQAGATGYRAARAASRCEARIRAASATAKHKKGIPEIQGMPKSLQS